MGNWLITPGHARVGVTDGFVLFVGAEAPAQITDRAFAASTHLEALDALFGAGISSAPTFCLVTVTEGHGTAYLRGSVTLRMEAQWGDAVVERAADVRSLREVSVQGVSRFAMFADDMVAHAETPIRRLHRLAEPVSDGTHEASLLIWERTETPHSGLITTPSPQRAFPEDLFEPQHSTQEHDEPEPPADAQIPAEPPADAQADTVEVPNLYDELFGATVHTNIERAAVRLSTPEEEQADAVPAKIPTWQLTLPSEEVVPVTYAAVLGRKPAPHELADAGSTRLIALPDPQGNISRSHVLTYVAEERLFVQDLHSTNGTHLVRSDETLQLPPDTPVELFEGDAFVLGGEAHVQVRRSS